MYINANTINPYIRVAMQSVLSAGTKIKQRVIFDYELIYIESGSLTLNYNKINYKCSAGQFIFIRPAISHSFNDIETDLSQPHIHFDLVYSTRSSQTPISFKDIGDLSKQEHNLFQKDVFEGFPQNPIVNFKNKEEALNLFYSIINDTSQTPLMQKSKLIQLIDILASDNFPNCFISEEKNYDIAHQIKDFIDTEQGLSASLEDFEKQFAYSKYHLERQFKKNYNIGIIAYRNQKRLELAKLLLKEENVTAISQKLGFSSIYAFSRAFKDYYGISPSKYKK